MKENCITNEIKMRTERMETMLKRKTQRRGAGSVTMTRMEEEEEEEMIIPMLREVDEVGRESQRKETGGC